jgi:glycosyltransferase involved in cell wall biosynthesis
MITHTTICSASARVARRVAIVEDTSAIGGAEINTLNLVRHSDANNLKLFVFVPQSGALAEALAGTSAHVSDLKIPHFRSISSYWRGRKVLNPLAIVIDLYLVLLFILRIWQSARRFRIEILHTNGIFAHFAGGIASRLAGCCCIWHLQDIIEPQHRFRRWLLNSCGSILADKIMVISQPVLAQITGSLQERAVLVPNGVDLCLFQARQDHPPYGSLRTFAGKRFLVILVARITRWKAQHILLEAAHQISTQRSDIAFALVGDAALGDADYAAELQRFVRSHQLEDVVMFAGWQKDMAAVYAQADILVLTAVEPEPFGLVVIEAMASGLPVIATNHGGPAHIIEHDITGLLVPPGDVLSLVASINRLADEPAVRSQMAQRARSHVEEHFSIEAYIERVRKVYETIC